MTLHHDYLKALNAAQLTAVQHQPDIPLQILAGPGSGKTKVLTSRIAYLILQHDLPPNSICAVTFTNKAANEMRERLEKLIGKERTDEVRMGTFHAICALFLRRHSTAIGIERNFTVCDSDESKRIISKLLKPYKNDLSAKDITLKEGTVLSLISNSKSKGQDADDVLKDLKKRQIKAKTKDGSLIDPPTGIEVIVAEIHQKYERILRKNNSLDFDDLLIFGVKLFSEHRKVIKWCRHVLVDEFQDTNAMQYELMSHLAKVNKCVTIVGDPDQSIYGWRSAEVENLKKMQRDFSNTRQIFLEQNYRSTGAILKASLAIVAQDKARIAKTLHGSHPAGVTPFLRCFDSEQEEANFVAVEIKRIAASMGGILGWGDFVVLLRFNALSRTVESALQKEGIPSRVLGGHKFFDRMEVKDLLAYLQLVDNPQFEPAFIRAINSPNRGVGEKTLAEIISRAQSLVSTSPLEVIEMICDSRHPDIKPPIKRKASPFVKIIRSLRTLTAKGTSPADLIRQLVEMIEYGDHLRRTEPDWESRWENVQELINFASEVGIEVPPSEPKSQSENEEDESQESSFETPLRVFLQASMLSSEGEQTNESNTEKVTISTCHAAKGLEWPVVMIPAVEKGTFPFYRSEDVEEERRLLYVACTRAQSLLYLSNALKRKVAGETKPRELSEFVSAVSTERVFSAQLPNFSSANREVISRVLGRPPPNTQEVDRMLDEFHKTHRDSYHDRSSSQTISSQTTSGLNSQGSNLPTSVALNYKPVISSARLLNNPGAARQQDLVATGSFLGTAKTLRPGPTSLMACRPQPSKATQPINPVQCEKGALMQHPRAPVESAVQQNPLSTASGAASVTGEKRRLGMGRGGTGYSNKKFKVPT